MDQKASKTNEASLEKARIAQVQRRMAAKARWKTLSGNRYTADELKEMSKGVEVKILPRKRIVMKY